MGSVLCWCHFLPLGHYLVSVYGKRQTGHWLVRKWLECGNRGGLSMKLSSDKPPSVPDKEGSGTGSIDPVLGQESSHCQSLMRITINQETIEPPSPRIEWKAPERMGWNHSRWPEHVTPSHSEEPRQEVYQSTAALRDVYHEGLYNFIQLDLCPAHNIDVFPLLWVKVSSLEPEIF